VSGTHCTTLCAAHCRPHVLLAVLLTVQVRSLCCYALLIALLTVLLMVPVAVLFMYCSPGGDTEGVQSCEATELHLHHQDDAKLRHVV
jgi:hypothetical protein